MITLIASPVDQIIWTAYCKPFTHCSPLILQILIVYIFDSFNFPEILVQSFNQKAALLSSSVTGLGSLTAESLKVMGH